MRLANDHAANARIACLTAAQLLVIVDITLDRDHKFTYTVHSTSLVAQN